MRKKKGKALALSPQHSLLVRAKAIHHIQLINQASPLAHQMMQYTTAKEAKKLQKAPIDMVMLQELLPTILTLLWDMMVQQVQTWAILLVLMLHVDHELVVVVPLPVKEVCVLVFFFSCMRKKEKKSHFKSDFVFY
jgi:hypothetical protein